MIDYALEYAKRGWYIFPLRPKDKRPLTQHGVKDSSNDIEQVKRWWTQWPNANIGLDCGASGIIAVDVDAKSGGVQSWSMLKQDYNLPDTLTSRTGGGGFHLLYTDPKRQYRNSTSKIAQGIDTRGQNGYIVLPPSVHPSGRLYQWDDQAAQLCPMPRALSDRLVNQPVTEHKPIPVITTGDQIIQAAEALRRLNRSRADDYEDWIRVGMALHELGESGRALWVDWSRQSSKFDDKVCEEKWSTFHPSDIKLASLFYMANQDSPREPQAREIFGPIDSPHFDDEPAVPMPDVPPQPDLVDEKPKETKQQWHICTLADAYAPRPPLEFVVDGLFTLPSLSIVYGNSGSLKSMLLADMAACIAAGRPWLTPTVDSDDLSRHVIQVPALWCDFDNGKRRTDERFDAIGHAYSMPTDSPLYYVSMPSPWLNIGDNNSLMQFYDDCSALGVKFIVIDNLGVTIGGSDENSAEMATVMGNARWLAEQLGAAIVFIHHQRKANGISGHMGDDLRGHSSIKAALDLALLVEREDRSKSVTVKSTKTRDIDVAPFGARFDFQHKPGTSEMDWGRFFCESVDDSNSDTAIERTIYDVLASEHPLNQSKLVTRVKAILEQPGRNRISAVAEKLVQIDRLKVEIGRDNAKLYDLA